MEDIRKRARKMGSDFAVSSNGSGYTSTHGETHDTFRVDDKGRIRDFHTSTELQEDKKKSRWHER